MLTCNYELIEITALQYIFEGIGYYFNEEIYEQECYCQYPVVFIYVWIVKSKATYISDYECYLHAQDI